LILILVLESGIYSVVGFLVLVAYWVANSPTPPDHTELRLWLSKQLPDYMIPATFMLLEFLPLTPNGKVDRRALPALLDEPKKSVALDETPRTELEQMIATVWQEILCREKVGIYEPFFELGGHSLLLVQVQEKLTTTLNRPVPITVLFQYVTIQRLADYLSQPVNSGDAIEMETAVARARQQRIWCNNSYCTPVTPFPLERNKDYCE
jgi:hypothetical protein